MNTLKKIFIAGVTAGREIEKEFHQKHNDIGSKYYNLIEWEAEKISEYYNMFEKDLYQQIINEAYENYCKNVPNEIVNVGDTFIDTKRNLISTCKRKEIGTSKKVPILICEYEGCYIEEDCKKVLTQEEFINKCKTNPEFSEKWGLKIEERELRLGERYEIKCKKENVRNDWEQFYSTFGGYKDEIDSLKKSLNNANIPTKLITIIYNNETIEVYE